MHPQSITKRKRRPFSEAYFWERVDRSGECWPWVRYCNTDGYGHVYYEGRIWGAHRVAWILTNGPIPEGMRVLHNCPGGDNPACCNPAHLFLGTQADNVHDMMAKGRNTPQVGIANPRARLTEEDVREIRRLYATGDYAYAGIAEAFGVGETTISHVVKGDTWADVE